ncbi:MAG: hypothetical protein AAGK74_14595 [Chloroflexota bacterium]
MNLNAINADEVLYFLEVAQSGDVYQGELLNLNIVLFGLNEQQATVHLYAWIVGYVSDQLERRRNLFGVTFPEGASDTEKMRADFEKKDATLRGWSALYYMTIQQRTTRRIRDTVGYRWTTINSSLKYGLNLLVADMQRLELTGQFVD